MVFQRFENRFEWLSRAHFSSFVQRVTLVMKSQKVELEVWVFFWQPACLDGVLNLSDPGGFIEPEKHFHRASRLA